MFAAISRSLLDGLWLLGLAAVLVGVYVVDREQSLVDPRAMFVTSTLNADGETDPVAAGNSGSLVRTAKAAQARGKFDLGASIYVGRTKANRVEEAKKVGGTVLSEAGVKNGLAWLARHQAESGAWLPENLGTGPRTCCNLSPHCTQAGQNYGVADTGVALLAFQGAGHFAFNEAEHSDRVRRGLEWLVKQQHEDGKLAMRGNSHYFMYEHGIATFALAESMAVAVNAGVEVEPKIRQATNRAVRFILEYQHNDGGWRYTGNKDSRSDTSVSGWQVLALKAAKEAGIEFDPGVIDEAGKFFESCRKSDGQTGYQAGGGLISQATTGVGLLFEMFMRPEPDREFVEKAAGFLADYAEKEWPEGRQVNRNDRDFYLWYNCTLGMFQAGDPYWSRWNEIVRERILALQESSTGCMQGSWTPTASRDKTGGRIYTTSLAVLTLEVYYRYARLHEDK